VVAGGGEGVGHEGAPLGEQADHLLAYPVVGVAELPEEALHPVPHVVDGGGATGPTAHRPDQGHEGVGAGRRVGPLAHLLLQVPPVLRGEGGGGLHQGGGLPGHPDGA